MSELVHQKLGELIAAAADVREDVREVKNEVRTVRHGQASISQQVVCLDFRMGQLDKRLGKLEPTVERVQTAEATVAVLRRGLLLAAAPLLGVAGWVSTPIREWVVSHVSAWLQ